MALPPCRLCGHTDPARMIGLMTLWFGRYVGIERDHGYFHLCPGCFEELVEPHLGEDADLDGDPDPDADLDPEPDPEPDPDAATGRGGSP